MSNELAQVEAPTLARPDAGMLMPLVAPAQIIQRHDQVAQIIQGALKEGRDYGQIPGTGGKPTLLKPGAEALMIAFGLMADFEVVAEEVDHDRECLWTKRKKEWLNRHRGDREFRWVEESGTSLGLYRYVVRCRLIHKMTGEVVGSGIGVCSSLESKYIDRPRDCENTVLKMAEKRALVAAVVVTIGLSDRFTQDVEDMADNAEASKAQPKFPGSGQFLKSLGLTPDQVSAFKTRCGANGFEWGEIALRAKAEGAADFESLMEFAAGDGGTVTAEIVDGVPAPTGDDQPLADPPDVASATEDDDDDDDDDSLFGPMPDLEDV